MVCAVTFDSCRRGTLFRCRVRSGAAQGDSEERQLGLFFFKEADAKALIDKVAHLPTLQFPCRASLAKGVSCGAVDADRWRQCSLYGPSCGLVAGDANLCTRWSVTLLFLVLTPHTLHHRTRRYGSRTRGWRSRAACSACPWTPCTPSRRRRARAATPAESCSDSCRTPCKSRPPSM